MSFVFTNDNCIGCNKCIQACSCVGANVVETVNGKNVVHVDPQKCISCAACFDVCEHKHENLRMIRSDSSRI